jgi:hypothetical protein
MTDYSTIEIPPGAKHGIATRLMIQKPLLERTSHVLLTSPLSFRTERAPVFAPIALAIQSRGYKIDIPDVTAEAFSFLEVLGIQVVKLIPLNRHMAFERELFMGYDLAKE